MKSTIKVDIGLDGKALINVCAYESWDDLRDKALNMFLMELNPHGRICFIDSSGSKLSGSAGGDNYSTYSIKPISPDNYELLIKEIEILIKERDQSYERPIGYFEERKKEIEAIDEWEFRKAMNY